MIWLIDGMVVALHAQNESGEKTILITKGSSITQTVINTESTNKDTPQLYPIAIGEKASSIR